MDSDGNRMLIGRLPDYPCSEFLFYLIKKKVGRVEQQNNTNNTFIANIPYHTIRKHLTTYNGLIDTLLF